MDSDIELINLIIFPFHFFFFIINVTLDFAYFGMIFIAYLDKFAYILLKK